MYDWSTYFNAHFKLLHGLTKQHHFYFSSEHKGIVKVKEYATSDTTEHTILLRNSTWLNSSDQLHSELPPVITPLGLSEERQLYLYEKIREFCREDVRDLVCPRPNFLPPTSPTQMSLPSSQETDYPRKRGRICSNCGTSRHNKRTCNKQS